MKKLAQEFSLDGPIPGTTVKAPVPQKPGAVKPTIPATKPTGSVAVSPTTSTQTVPTSIPNRSVLRMQNILLKIREEFLKSELFNQHGTHDKNDQVADDGAFVVPLLDRNVNKNPSFKPAQSQKDNKPWTFINRLESILNVGVKDNKGSSKPDGVWGKNTNLALQGITDIIETVSNISQKLALPRGLQISPEEIKTLKENIPSDPSKDPHLTEKADAISSVLESLEAKIENFGVGVNNTFATYKNDQKGLDAGFGEKPSNEQRVNSLPGLNTTTLSGIPQDISNPDSSKLNLSLKNLFNIESLKTFIKDNRITVNGKDPIEDGSLINKFIDYLKNGITSGQIKINPGQEGEADNFQDPWRKK